MSLVTEISKSNNFSDESILKILKCSEYDDELFLTADKIRREIYGEDVYIRGLIEFTNYCKNDCLYCGIRRSNLTCDRYRLSKENIYECCTTGYGLGFRTFVLQGGEDMFFSDRDICEIVFNIKSRYPDCAVTLSIGERSRQSYLDYKNAGADRYLLRHETANNEHYKKLHPLSMSLENRKKCLFTLKELGYQVGSGFMVGSPFQTLECLVEDLRFLQKLQPDMIGIGPFLSHKNTPFKDFPNGDLSLTLRLISLLRLIFPKALIPSTTALGTLHPQGRELGLKCGANVVMPNLSPVKTRKKYELYDNKICTGEESAECKANLEQRIEGIGYKVVTDKGDAKTRL